MWHNLSSALYFVIRATVERMWALTPYPPVKVHSNNLITGVIWYINIINMHINSWFKSCECLSYFPLSAIGNFLSDYL